MARINNYKRISLDGFSGENAQLIRCLGDILNPFMREVTDVINGNIDFDNLSQNVITLEVTVDSNGKPVSNQINSGVTNPKGFQVIRAINNTNPAVTVTGQPFIVFSPQGNEIVSVSKITNLQANNKYLLTIVVY